MTQDRTTRGEAEDLAALARLFGPEDKGGGHIVDILIAERARRLMAHGLTRGLVRRIAYPALRYEAAVALADAIRPLGGEAIFGHVSRQLGLRLRLAGLEHVPARGRVLVVANHPTGLADGIAVFDALRRVRGDLRFFANSDALRVAPGFAEMVIPVEWVLAKRSRAKTRVMIAAAERAFAQECAVVIFPSGRLAHWTGRGLRDKPWAASALGFVRRYDVPVVPLNIRARNSWLYYVLHALNAELRDITLFNETLNKAGGRFGLAFGPPIEPDRLRGDPERRIRELKAYVEEGLARGLPAEAFLGPRGLPDAPVPEPQ